MSEELYIDFIQGKSKESFVTEVNNESGTVENSFEITKGDETRKYNPIDFFNLILNV